MYPKLSTRDILWYKLPVVDGKAAPAFFLHLDDLWASVLKKKNETQMTEAGETREKSSIPRGCDLSRDM